MFAIAKNLTVTTKKSLFSLNKNAQNWCIDQGVLYIERIKS